MPAQKRAVRVAGASGGFSDRQRAIHDLARYSEVDVIIGGKSIIALEFFTVADSVP